MSPPTLKPTERDGNPVFNSQARSRTHMFCDIVCDDQVLMCTQYSTQWDSLAHVGQMFDADGDGRAEDVFYNGYRAGRDIIGPAFYDAQGNMTPCDEPQGARHLGVQNMAETCMQGRGVLIGVEDVPAVGEHEVRQRGHQAGPIVAAHQQRGRRGRRGSDRRR